MARLMGWVQTHPRGMVIALVVVSLPYLILCNGLALFIVGSLLSGGCGG